MSITQITLRDKATYRLLRLYMAEWSSALVYNAKRLVLQCINGMSSKFLIGEILSNKLRVYYVFNNTVT